MRGHFSLTKEGLGGVNLSDCASLEWLKNRWAILGGESEVAVEGESLRVVAELA